MKTDTRESLKHDPRGTHKHDPRDNMRPDQRDTTTGAFSFWIVGYGIVGTSRIKAA